MKRDDLAQHLNEARERFEPRWDDARSAHVRAGLPARAQTHRRRRVAVGAAVLLALGVVAFSLRPVRSVVAIEPLAEAHVVSLERTETLERFRVERHGAWFDVTPNQRTVRVEADDVVVEVLGTKFLVERVDARVHVVVERGVVRVSSRGVVRTLETGASGWFPEELAHVEPAHVEPAHVEPAHVEPAHVEPAHVEPVHVEPAHVEPKSPETVVPRPRQSTKQTPAVKPAPPQTWTALAQSGDFDAAWSAMKTAPAPRDEPAELLLAADVARLSRHPDQALAPLRRVLEAHAKDPRAPLAAFTLGRVLLDDLGRPKEAAAAFERARGLAPEAPLAEDALAREVEALSRAQSPEAKARADLFVQRYPSSPRLRAVRHFGGLK
jgi:transmembrane sensor